MSTQPPALLRNAGLYTSLRVADMFFSMQYNGIKLNLDILNNLTKRSYLAYMIFSINWNNLIKRSFIWAV